MSKYDVYDFNHGILVGVQHADMSSCWFSWDFQFLEFTQNCRSGPRWVAGSGNSSNHSLQSWWAEKHLNVQFQQQFQQKTTWSTTPVTQEQECEATVDKGLLKLDSWFI